MGQKGLFGGVSTFLFRFSYGEPTYPCPEIDLCVHLVIDAPSGHDLEWVIWARRSQLEALLKYALFVILGASLRSYITAGRPNLRDFCKYLSIRPSCMCASQESFRPFAEFAQLYRQRVHMACEWCEQPGPARTHCSATAPLLWHRAGTSSKM